MIIIGIDPGLGGAVAAISTKLGLLGVWDTPVIEVKKGKTKRREYVFTRMLAIFNEVNLPKIGIVGIEQVHAMPKNGSIAGFRLGYGLAAWEMAVVALSLPKRMVTPQTWKKVFGLKSDKKASVLAALDRIPASKEYLTLAKHEGRAEAILIAEYFRLQYLRERNVLSIA